MSNLDRFSLKNKVVVITGAAGFFAKQQINAVFKGNGNLVLIDIDKRKIDLLSKKLRKKFKNRKILCLCGDICDEKFVKNCLKEIKKFFRKIDVLINNAAIDYKPMRKIFSSSKLRLENFDFKNWEKDINVGLKGATICSKVFGGDMTKKRSGVILNIASDLALISPDNRLYEKKGVKQNNQAVKPVTYSVVKHGIIGLTKYISTYWAKYNLRCNAIAPGGIENNQDKPFKEKISKLIPLGRLSKKNEYEEAILFLISDASSYMTGSTLVIDGGRTVW